MSNPTELLEDRINSLRREMRIQRWVMAALFGLLIFDEITRASDRPALVFLQALLLAIIVDNKGIRRTLEVLRLIRHDQQSTHQS